MNCNITIIVLIVVIMFFVINYDLLTHSVQELNGNKNTGKQQQVIKELVLQEIADIDNKAASDVTDNLEIEMAKLDKENQDNSIQNDDSADSSSSDSSVEPAAEPAIEFNEQVPEPFTDYISAHLIEKDPRKTTDKYCPFISFYQSDKDFYCASSDTLYGCTNATPGSGIEPYDAKFSVIGGYLGSLPDTSPAKMHRCALKHRDVIRNWNLCEGNRLAEKNNYAKYIDQKKAKDRFLKVNYKDNKKIVDAINYAC